VPELAYNAAMANGPYLTGQLLVAMPAMADSRFERSVTYLCQHDADGALGLVVNRPSGMRLGDVLEELGLGGHDRATGDRPVLSGGPVHPERGFVLHGGDGRAWDSSLEIGDGLVLTTSRDILAAVADGSLAGPWLFALGYAGWSAGQLEQELLANAWLTVPSRADLLFEMPLAERWQAAARQLGVDPGRLTGYAGHA